MDDIAEGGAEVVDRLLDKHFEKLPDKYFRADTYNPLKKTKSGRDKDRRSSSASHNNPKASSDKRRNRAAGAAAGAGAAAVAEADGHDSRDRRRRSEDNDRRRNDSPDQYGSQYEDPRGYPHQELQTQANRAEYSQGDPRFPATAQSYNPPYNPYANSTSGSMGDQYQPRGGGQQGSNSSAGGYHRYNPADYQPRDYSPNNRDDRRYSTNNRQQIDPYRRDQQDTSQAQSGRREYDDDDSQDDRRGRGEKGSGKHSKRESSSPESRNPVLRTVHKNLDATGEGLAYGAVGAAVGGFIGHKFGKHPLATVAGAVIGGLGANAFEAREHNKKDEQHHREKQKIGMGGRRARSEGPSSSSARQSSSRGRDRRGGEYSEDDEPYDSEEEYQRKKAERRARRSARND